MVLGLNLGDEGTKRNVLPTVWHEAIGCEMPTGKSIPVTVRAGEDWVLEPRRERGMRRAAGATAP